MRYMLNNFFHLFILIESTNIGTRVRTGTFGETFKNDCGIAFKSFDVDVSILYHSDFYYFAQFFRSTEARSNSMGGCTAFFRWTSQHLTVARRNFTMRRCAS